jgi:hypothetical protein
MNKNQLLLLKVKVHYLVVKRQHKIQDLYLVVKNQQNKNLQDLFLVDNKLHQVNKSQVDHYLEDQNLKMQNHQGHCLEEHRQIQQNQLAHYSELNQMQSNQWALYLEELKLKGQSQQVHYLVEHNLKQQNRVDHYLEGHKLILLSQRAHYLEECNLMEQSQQVNFSELNLWRRVVHSLGELKIIITKYLASMLNLQLHYLLQVQVVVFLELKHLALQVALVEVVPCLVVVKHLINLVDPYLAKPTICLINLLIPPIKSQNTEMVNRKKMRITSLPMNLLQLL